MKKLLSEVVEIASSPDGHRGSRNDKQSEILLPLSVFHNDKGFLIKSELPKLKKYIFSKVSDQNEAEEILQETLISSHESFPFFKKKSTLFTWLCAIANHEIADFYRKKKIKTLLFSHFPFLETIVSEALSPDENLEKQELRKEVKNVLSGLSEGYSQILRLKYYQGLSMGEIAQGLRTTVKAVESRLSRAREAFKSKWIVQSSKCKVQS